MNLKKRQIYLIDEIKGITLATTTAWFSTLNNKPIGVVHALSCLPEYRLLGLGKLVATYMMKCFYDLMPNCDVWLDNQTWSYKAIGIYMNLGFIPVKHDTFNDAQNQYDNAIKVLNGKMRFDIYEKFINSRK